MKDVSINNREYSAIMICAKCMEATTMPNISLYGRGNFCSEENAEKGILDKRSIILSLKHMTQNI